MSNSDPNQLLLSFLNANPDVLAQLQQQQQQSSSTQAAQPASSQVPAQQEQLLPSVQQQLQPSFQLPIPSTGLIQQQQLFRHPVPIPSALPVQQQTQLPQSSATPTLSQPGFNAAVVPAQPITPYNSLNMLASLSRTGQTPEASGYGGHPRASSVFF